MKKRKLSVFIGKPGVGKTTLIKAAFPDRKFVDVLPFIEKFRLPNGEVQEEKLVVAYQEMYDHLGMLADEFIVLEIGTGFPEENIKHLKKISEDFRVSTYLCLASEETHWKRAHERGMRHSTEAFRIRMARVFPEEHIRLLDSAGLPYSLLDMEEPLEKIIGFLDKR